MSSIMQDTYDFVAPNGALTCGLPGQQIEDHLFKLINQFAEERQFIVIANDIHHEYDTCHPESKLFPPHNLKDSLGRLLYGKVKDTVESLAQAKFPNLYTIDKTRYSAFAGTDLALRLRERNIKELHLTGVCTDICVLHTAVDAYNLGFDIVVHADAVASFNQSGHAWALNHFAGTLGAVVIKK
jgi:nicotinamidase-related amidase